MEPKLWLHFYNLMIKLEQMKSCFLRLSKESVFWDGIYPWWRCEDHSNNLFGKTAVAFERTKSNFQRRPTVGMVLSNTIAGYKEIPCERVNRCGKFHYCHILRNCPSSPDFQQPPRWLVSCQQPSALGQDPLPEKRFTESLT